MEKIKNFYEKYKIIDIIIILLLIFSISFIYAKHLSFILPDRGREFLIPQAIMEGKIPYKDITLVYFPLAYYINAVIYKLLGVSINSLILTQSLVCSVYVIFYYYLSRIFLNRFCSLVLSLLIISCCIFSSSDIFSYIIPYSYARVYGLVGYLICIFAIIKLHKTDNSKYVYLASLAAGFSACCKLEYLTVIIFLVAGVLLYKKFELGQYVKIVLSFLVFPIITFSIMFAQGVTIKEFADSIIFSLKFAQTYSMTEHLVHEGMYPKSFALNLKEIFDSVKLIIVLLFFSFVILKIYKNYKKIFVPFLICVIVWNFYYTANAAEKIWLVLPIAVTVTFILLFSRLKENYPILLLVIGALLVSQREYFALSLLMYGAYAFPLLILSVFVLIDKYPDKKEFYGINISNIFCLFIIILIGFHSYNTYSARKASALLIETPKGNIYAKYNSGFLIYKTIKYVEDNIDKNATVLVLPEGNFINFSTDRKVDMHCFMMDRLYHDAYGEQKAMEKIEKSKSDYIIIFKNSDLGDFYKPYLYSKGETLSAVYIYSHYDEVKAYEYRNNQVIILKRRI